MRPANLLFLLSDEHTRRASGCYGHPVAHTPHLDRLARGGTRFTSAYTSCPICVPARASLATGRYVHQTGCWDNAFPYDGRIPSWAHRLREQGYQVASIGKLHFRSAEEGPGVTVELDPLHVVDGIGDLLGSIRDDPPPRQKRGGILEAGPGDSTYLQYDARTAARAVRWLQEHARDERPWVLFVSFVCPHPPYVAPQRLFDLYPPESIPLPPQSRPGDYPEHPALARMRRQFGYGDFDEPTLRKAIAAYLGACTYLDERIGEVLTGLEAAGRAGDTRILYTSDHGENLGARGLWGKFTMYEESAGIPLLLHGPEVPAGKVVETPVSLVDCFPTVLECVGAEAAPEDRELPGASLRQIAHEGGERTAFSEYHALHSQSAVYLVRRGRYKYVRYVGEPPQLFDLEADPDELRDLALLPEFAGIAVQMDGRLRAILDPEQVDAQAKEDQRRRIEAFGGREAVIRRGTFDNSPVPGEAPAFH